MERFSPQAHPHLEAAAAATTTPETHLSKLLLDGTAIERETYENRGYVQVLNEAYERQCSITHPDDDATNHEVVFITGPSGVGKIGLALTLEDKIAQDNGFLCQAKFDKPKLKTNAPERLSCQNSYEPIVFAIDELIKLIVQRGGRSILSVQASIRRDLDSTEIQALEDSIPALRRISSADASGKHIEKAAATQQRWRGLKGIEAEKRYMHILAKLLQAMCSRDFPLVMLISDLQWADSKALQLLKLLIASSKSTRFLIICTIKITENTSTADEDLLSTLTLDLQNSEVTATEIRMSNLCNLEIQRLALNALELPIGETERFSKMLHIQTGGNVFFLKQLLAVLQRERLLGFNSEVGKGFWHEEKILTTFSSHKTVVDVLRSRMLQLTEYEQGLLNAASCLGRDIHECLLAETALPTASVGPALLRVKELGFIKLDTTTKAGRFLHHHIQEAAYSLIPESERAKMHLNIGLRLWIWLTPEDKDVHLFTVANQIIQGIQFLDDPVEKEDLAKFMLRVGEKASLVSSFSTAAAYLDVGIGLLRPRHWKHQYSLSLSLYTTAAEVQYYNGNLAAVDRLLAKIFKHAKSLDDKLQAHFTHIYSLGSRDETKQALSKGLEVLRLLGEIFPIRPINWHASFAVARSKCFLRGMTDDDIMNLPQMSCHRKLVVQRLMNTIYGFALANCKILGTLIVSRMVENTIRYGISPMSCLGFTLYGYCQGRRGNVEEERRFGRLGWRMMERFKATEWLPRVVVALVYNVTHSLRDQIKPLQAAHCAGLVQGDVIVSMVCASFQCRLSLYASDPLSDLVDRIEKYLSFCNQYNMTGTGVLLRHQLQVCLNFMGRATNPVVLTSEIMDEVQTINEIQDKHPVAFTWLLLMKHLLLVYFHELKSATEISSQIYKQLTSMKTAFILPFATDAHLFLDGVTAATMSRDSKPQQKRAHQILSKLKDRKRFTGGSYENKICLIEAELLAASGDDHNAALSKYQQSIEAARREGFLHEQALALEKAGRALLKIGQMQSAQTYLETARSLYSQWGAGAKVQQIERVLLGDVDLH